MAIKHLTPKSKEELDQQFKNLSPKEKLKSYQEMGIKLSQKEMLELFHFMPDRDKRGIYLEIRKLGLDKKTLEELFSFDGADQLAKKALSYNKPDLYKYALDKGHIMTKSDQKQIITHQRYYDNLGWSNNWSEIVEKYINVKSRKKILERDPEENKKDFNKARKKINDAIKDLTFKDITTERQENHGTMMFNAIKNSDRIQFSLTQRGYVRKHWSSGFSTNSAPIIENPYLTYQEMADVLIRYVRKNNYVKE